MAYDSNWLYYDADVRRRSRRKWPWVLVALLLAALAALLVAAFMIPDAELDLQAGQPVAIQEALPALLTDNVTVIYVVDNSDSMETNLPPLHGALENVATKHTDNSEIGMMRFGSYHNVLFDISDPTNIAWEAAIPTFAANGGKTNMYSALISAVDLMPANPTCTEHSRWIFFSETICRDQRIVLMSDGMATDPQYIEDALNALLATSIPVDTIAFGIDADRKTLEAISGATGGRFITAK
jgi:hypothetical protein